MKKAKTLSESDAFRIAHEEVKRKCVREDVWLKAFAHGNGDERSTTAKYVLFRAEELMSTHAQAIAAKQRAAISSRVKSAATKTVETVSIIADELRLFAIALFAISLGIVGLLLLFRLLISLFVEKQPSLDLWQQLLMALGAAVGLICCYNLRWILREFDKKPK